MVPLKSNSTRHTISLRVCLNGASGRMGQRVDRACNESAGIAIVTARNSLEAPIDGATTNFDVVIDFSSDVGTQKAVGLALHARCPLLIGTTGITDTTREILRSASVQIPVLVAPNTSIGVAVMRHLISEAARLLADDFQISISEVHHTQKRDQPSGTALALADSVASGRGKPFPTNEIQSIREGDVIGDHEVVLSGPGEVLTVRHHARDRDLFALGAIRLAIWIAKQPPGMYGLDDWFAQFKKAK
ncbi:MAG: 4-hydroxy-tetrahydrodipicolinate reductase [Planctomycetota bacterium]|nr:4-hydroxy-tetrahydrodipicolinate reductase [Planctomycetota bacterium]MDA1261700.1 4-hydroxy-tetrahydrodipicolinate reductase [Planctomycetota bacterium]